MARWPSTMALVLIGALAGAGCGADDSTAPEVDVVVITPDDATTTTTSRSADATPTTAPTTGSTSTTAGGPVGADSVAVAIELVADDAEMNLQPDGQGWGRLSVDGAYSSRFVDDRTAAEDTKLLVVDVQVIPVNPGNLVAEAFRLEHAGIDHLPVGRISEIANIGEVYNDSILFEIPVDAATVTLHGGVPKGPAAGRRTAYEITLAPGRPEAAPVAETAVDGAVGAITATGPTAEISTQPDDEDWGTLTVDAARSGVIAGDLVATPDTKLVTIDITVTGGRGNLFDRAFRLRAGDEWYSPITRINETLEEGQTYRGELVFEVPRSAFDLVLEAGFPSALDAYQWPFTRRTVTVEIDFDSPDS